MIGSVLFGIEINGDKISRVEILAEQHGAGFGEMVEQMLSEWSVSDAIPEHCAQPFYVTTAMFMF